RAVARLRRAKAGKGRLTLVAFVLRIWSDFRVQGDRFRVAFQQRVKYRHALTGRAARLLEAVRRKKQHLGVGVVEIEAKLVLFVRRVQRRGRAGGRRRQKGDDHWQTVRQRDADAIAARDARGGELIRNGTNLLAQFTVGHPNVRFGKNDSGFLRRVSIEQF